MSQPSETRGIFSGGKGPLLLVEFSRVKKSPGPSGVGRPGMHGVCMLVNKLLPDMIQLLWCFTRSETQSVPPIREEIQLCPFSPSGIGGWRSRGFTPPVDKNTQIMELTHNIEPPAINLVQFSKTWVEGGLTFWGEGFRLPGPLGSKPFVMNDSPKLSPWCSRNMQK